MLYWLLCWEFFKIGLLAIGGGLVTVPFLFDLSRKYYWFTTAELADMIAVSQSTPGPLGVNMATYVGYKVAGLNGALIATLSEVLPSMIIIYVIAVFLQNWSENVYVKNILRNMRPAVLALILFAGWDIAFISINNYKSLVILLALLAVMRFYKKNAIFYIAVSALIGIIFKI